VFSCSWTPSSVEHTNLTLQQHAHVLALAKTAKLAQLQDEAFGGGGDAGGGQSKRRRQAKGSMPHHFTPGGAKEERRVAIENGEQAEVDALRGNWERYAPGGVLRSEEEEKVQVGEFMALLRMRRVDVGR
jgi:hypothetical protein